MSRLLLCCLLFLLSACTPADNPLRICFTGDLLLDRGVRQKIGRDGVHSLFEKISPLLKQADYTVANLECPVTKTLSPVNKRFIFRAEPEWLEALQQAGISHLVMANNHSNDQGRDQLRVTAAHLQRYGLVPVGYGINHEAACQPVIIEKKGQRVYIFSSVTLPLENWMFLENAPAICQDTPEQLALRIRELRAREASAFIVVVLHWGIEFRHIPTLGQKTAATRLINAGADAIVGHHPHVIQSVEYYRGKPILYSLGNFVFDQQHPAAQQCLVAELSFGNNVQLNLHPVQIKDGVPTPASPAEAQAIHALIDSISVKER